MHVLNFLSKFLLRIGSSKLPVFKSRIEETAFLDELEFWQIDFKNDCKNFIYVDNPILLFDPEWVATTLILDNNSLLVKKQSSKSIKIDSNHGIVFLKTPMDIYNSFVEYRVIMNIPSRGKNHLFVGLVDKSKYKYEHLSITIQ